MNGWQRLGIVLAAPVVALAMVAAYQGGKKAYVYGVLPSERAIKFDGQAFYDAVWDENKSRDDLQHCLTSTVRIERISALDGTMSISCQNNPEYPYLRAFEFGAIACAIFLAINAVIAWIYRGFKPSV